MLLLAMVACGTRYDVTAPGIPMADGVSLAADVIRPASPGPAPAVVIQTRYWRSFQLRFDRGPGAMPIQPREDLAAALVDAGYAVVLVDVRGTGASEGRWASPWSAAEVADLGEVVRWVAAQPWSDGRVGTAGVSYEGTTALLAAATAGPALKAVLAREIEWDLVDELLAPGGVRNLAFVASWGRSVAALDRGEYPELFPPSARWMVTGPRRRDADPDGSALARLVAERSVRDVAADVAGIRSPTDRYGTDGPLAAEIGPSAHAAALAGSPAAIAVWGSWWDGATADAVLRADAALRLVDARIGPWDHEGTRSVSPLDGDDHEVTLADEVAFFDAWLRGAGGPRQRRWYVAGADRWDSGATWPTPAPRTWALRLDGTLGEPQPLATAFDVDFTASVGTATRWSAGLLHPPEWADRRDAPGLVSWQTPPFREAWETFGASELRCTVDATPEAALHVYLEAVDASGEVRLLTEGVQRVTRGEVVVRLRPVAFALPRGGALRLSLAGADADTFERVPAAGPATVRLTGACGLTVGR